MLFFIFYDCNFIFLGRFSAIIFSFCCSYRSIRLLQFFVGDVILKESQRGEKILQEILYEQVHYSEQNAGKLAFVSKYDRIGGVTLPHWHDAFEITYVQKSELELTVGGKARIISEGDISYVNSGVVHSTRSVPSDRRGSGVVVLLSESMMKTACPEYEKYRFEIPEQLDISEIDLSYILSNAIENAINAAKNADEKLIDIYMSKTSEKLLISVKNTFKEMPEMVNGIPTTSKEGHGYGTQSIRYTTEKLKGNCHFTVSGNLFVLQVII